MLPQIRTPNSAHSTSRVRTAIGTTPTSSGSLSFLRDLERSPTKILTPRRATTTKTAMLSSSARSAVPRQGSRPMPQISEPVRIVKKRKVKTSSGDRKVIKLRMHLKLIVRVIIWFRRKALSHHITNTNDNLLPFLKQFSFLSEARKKDEVVDDIIFDRTPFRCNQDFIVLNRKTLQILDKKPSLRTDDDALYLCMRLRQLSTFADYPTVVQEKLAKCAIYQQYNSKRIILRQGHKPAGFYIILTGSVFAFSVNYETNYVLPTMILEQGGTFGDYEMQENIRRQSTWVSATDIEVLWITVQDYAEIYHLENMNLLKNPDSDDEEDGGGEKETKIQQFIKTLPHFKDWPVHILTKHSSKYAYRMYNRHDIVEAHTNKSTLLYFVIAGSISVVKRLPYPSDTPYDQPQAMYLGGQRRGLLRPKYVKQLDAYEPWMDESYRQLKLVYNLGGGENFQRQTKAKISTSNAIDRLLHPENYDDEDEEVFSRQQTLQTRTAASSSRFQSSKQSSSVRKQSRTTFAESEEVIEYEKEVPTVQDGRPTPFSDDNDGVVRDAKSEVTTPVMDSKTPKHWQALRRISKEVAMYSGFLVAMNNSEIEQRRMSINSSVAGGFSRRSSILSMAKATPRQSLRRQSTEILGGRTKTMMSLVESSRGETTRTSTAKIGEVKESFEGDDDDDDDLFHKETRQEEDQRKSIMEQLFLDSEGREWLSLQGLHLVKRRTPLDMTLFQKVAEANAAPTTNFSLRTRHANVLVEVIERGHFFGLASFFHSKQPDFILVAQTGAEVLIMDKDFYFQNCPHQLRAKLESQLVNGYPTETEFRNALQHYVDWERFRRDQLMAQINKRKSKDV